jgi:hypothetical protein
MRLLKRSMLFVPLLALAAVLVNVPGVAIGQTATNFSATLIGINETPSINTNGAATVKITLNADNTISFTVKYQNLSLAPTVAHIHFAETGVAGGVMVFFCGGGGQPSCPATTSGTITGTIDATQVQAIASQGLAAGDMASVFRAIRQGAGYANMHTTNFPAGEIRGQLKATAAAAAD